MRTWGGHTKKNSSHPQRVAVLTDNRRQDPSGQEEGSEKTRPLYCRYLKILVRYSEGIFFCSREDKII